MQSLDPMPFYDTMTDSEKLVVDQVTWMFGDLYDSTEGGPHFQDEFQTHWNYERIARMQQIAVQKMNFIGNYGNPPTTWSVGAGASINGTTIPGHTITNTQVLPDGSSTSITYTTSSSVQGGAGGIPKEFSGLVVWGTYIECLRHFRDTYTEIPQRPGMDVTYLDRSQYFQRWGQTLQSEEADYKAAVKSAKLSLLSLSRGSLLVAGGMFGSSTTGMFQSGTYAAQVRSWRFYPAAPAIAWGATSH
jgi:hypothetical protein